MIKQVLWVGLGGAVGSMARYLVSYVTANQFTNSFPLATFLVNSIGCFLVGMLYGLLPDDSGVQQQYKLLLITGFCGGFTTFSAFALENMKLLNSGNVMLPVVYTGLSIVVGFASVWLGIFLTR